MANLKMGDRVKSHNGKNYIIGELLGSGGQGDVFIASAFGKKVAIKWYHQHMATELQKNRIARLVALGSPSDKFLWPLEVVVSETKAGFGYVMKLRDSRYRSVVDFMTRKIELDFSQIIKVALQLVDSFETLHKKGLCYQDISFGNFFIEPVSADILICDNDNVSSESEKDGHVLGTPRFMAPEIVRGDSHPNVLSDLFSLSVLLFYLFMIHHPLEGALESQIRCFDLPAMSKLYGTNPVFIFDPINTVNRPIKGLHDNAIIFWNLYPHKFKRAFIHSFTTGLKPSRVSRLSEAQWREILVFLTDSLITCECGVQNFYDVGLNYTPIRSKCWNCGQKFSLKPHLNVDRRMIMIEPLKKIWIQKNRKSSYEIIGEIQTHPDNKNIFGIVNKSDKNWNVKFKDGRQMSIKSGDAVNIQKIINIDFDNGHIADICIGGSYEVTKTRR